MRRRLVVIVMMGLALSACGRDGAPARTSPPTTAAPRTDEEAVAAFVQAWSGGDAGAMRAVGDGEAVEAALRYRDPTAARDCFAQASGQYQCIVEVAGKTRLYLLIGAPGAVEGRVWWVSEYVPGT